MESLAHRYEIHPSVGVARVGSSPESFYLAPEMIGGQPIACDEQGNPILVDGVPQPVTQFKDEQGRIKRQAALFRIYRYDDARPGEGIAVTADQADVVKLEWTAHLANKKAIWYQFAELEGDLMLGDVKNGRNTNSYQACGVPLRNASTIDGNERRKADHRPWPTRAGQAKRIGELLAREYPARLYLWRVPAAAQPGHRDQHAGRAAHRLQRAIAGAGRLR